MSDTRCVCPHMDGFDASCDVHGQPSVAYRWGYDAGYAEGLRAALRLIDDDIAARPSVASPHLVGPDQ